MIQRIIINTDCMNAIHVYKNDMKAIKKYKLDKIYKEFTTQRNTFNQFTTQKGIMVEFRHVKAHERTDTARTYVNDWCDKNAKKALFSWIVKNKIAE